MFMQIKCHILSEETILQNWAKVQPTPLVSNNNCDNLIYVNNDNDILNMICFLEDEDSIPFATFSTSHLFTTTSPFNIVDSASADVIRDDIMDADPAGPYFLEEVEGSDYPTEDSVKYEAELIGKY